MFLIVSILVFLSPFILLSIFPEKPAIPEKMAEVLDEEFIKQQKQERLDNYMKLLDFLEAHKQQIIDSVSVKDTSECLHIFFGEYISPKTSKLPKHLLDACKPLLKSISPPSGDDLQPYLEICDKQFMTFVTGYTDRENYLYITYKFQLKGARKKPDSSSYYHIKEVLIKNKYFLSVEVSDAFNIIDPNGLF